MQNRFMKAREDNGWSRKEMAGKMGVEVSTVGNWEMGRRQMTIENLLRMAEITGFSIEYLLGFDAEPVSWTQPISKEALRAMHRSPVWTQRHGWGLVNAVEMTLVFADKSSISLDTLNESVYAVPPAFAISLVGAGDPLGLEELLQRKRVWVEPITSDAKLGCELRGWYRLQDGRLVQNEFGNRFYLDTYGAKWLAFEDCFGSEG